MTKVHGLPDGSDRVDVCSYYAKYYTDRERVGYGLIVKITINQVFDRWVEGNNRFRATWCVAGNSLVQSINND